MVGLPSLETLISRKAKAQQAKSIPRLLCVFSGSGMPMDEFTPQQSGPNYDLPGALLQPFAPIQSKVSVFTGLGVSEGRHSPGDHAAGTAAAFTCAQPRPQYPETNDQDYKDPFAKPAGLGISIDQVMANSYAKATPRLPTGLVLGLSKGLPLGDGPFGPIYLDNLSWKSATDWNIPIRDPVQVYSALFAGYDAGASSAENARRLRNKISVLDYVAEEGNSLLPAVSPADRRRLDQYYTMVRGVEQKLQPSALRPGCAPGAMPGSNLSYPDKLKAMSDLIAVAFTCDATRSVMFQLSAYRNDDMYRQFLAVNDNHSALARAADNDAPNSGYRIVCRWIMARIADLMMSLDAIHEPTGTVLDNSIVVYNSDFGTAYPEDHLNLPVMVGGSAGGKIPAGRHFVLPSNTPCNGLYVTLLQGLGVQIDKFGDKQIGPLELPAM